MYKIASYKNGNVITTIYNDGTKTHFTKDDEFKFDFAETYDVLISERCNNGCSWCYANCTKDGKEGNLLDWKFFDTLHPYTEMAINIQSPIHPHLFPFLYNMKEKGVIVNATVNQNHFMKDEVYRFLDFLINYGYITCIGVSLTDPTQEGFIERVKKYPNAVIHVIAGIVSPEDVDYLKDKDLKLLILGYKNKGRGKGYYEDSSTLIGDNIAWLESGVFTELINGFKVISFDNLAVEQLHVRNYLTEEQWERFYGGDDGTCSFFIDLVNGRFARSSLSETYYPINGLSIDEMFNVIRREVETETKETV